MWKTNVKILACDIPPLPTTEGLSLKVIFHLSVVTVITKSLSEQCIWPGIGLKGCCVLSRKLSYSCRLKVKLEGRLWPGLWGSLDTCGNEGSQCNQFLMSLQRETLRRSVSGTGEFPCIVVLPDF